MIYAPRVLVLLCGIYVGGTLMTHGISYERMYEYGFIIVVR